MPSSSPTISPTETPTFDPTPLHGRQHPLQSHRQLHRQYRVLVRLNRFSCGIKLLKHYNSLLAAAAHLTQIVSTGMAIVVLLLTESFLHVVITTIPKSVNRTLFHSINMTCHSSRKVGYVIVQKMTRFSLNNGQWQSNHS
jgi:hypothetical protein